PPMMVDVEDGPYGGIGFGDAAGDVWVYSPLGTVCGGWPRNVGELFWKSSIAVGALDLSGDPYIVAGTADGRVYAFAGDGTLHDGFPVDLGTGAATYVSIGALGPPHPRWIVACSGTRMFTISHSGTFGPYDWTYTYPLVGPAAIGDVDDDGVAEMVTLSGSVSAGSTSYVHVQQMDAPTQEMWRAFPSYSSSDAPTLFALDSDGDLEIAAPTRQGALFVMHHDGSDVGGFPFDNFTGQPLTSAAAAQFIGTIEPDLAVASQDWRVHLLSHDGAQQSSYPEETGYGWWLYGAPIIDQVNRTSANIIVGSRDTSGWSFQNTGGTPAGWPKGLGGTCEYSPASGDIDLDGDNEIVFLTHSQLILVDVNYPPEPLADNRWPMFGYDPQRTGCLNCVEDLATAVPGVGITRVSFAEPSPNPATDTLVFHYQLPAHAGVRLEIFDLRGRRVRSVLRREETAGPYSVSFDGLDERGQALGAGQYLARLSVRGPGLNEVQTRKFTLVR
ncbi:hypothetical protein H8E07_09595, partial [bacterium]|nr:hypothetical protein [bacterium]